jgi:alpha-glucosidase
MSDLRELLLGARMIGLRVALQSIRYTFARDRLERRYSSNHGSRPQAADGHKGLSEIHLTLQSPRLIPGQECGWGENGVRFAFSEGDLSVRFLAPDFLFIAWDILPQGSATEMLPSNAVIRLDWPEVKTQLEEVGTGWRLSSSKLRLEIGSHGVIHLFDSNNFLLHQEDAPALRTPGWCQYIHLAEEACVYGLGERAARLNLRPGQYRLWNRGPNSSYRPGSDPLYITMPIFLSLHKQGSVLAFYDNPSDGWVKVGDHRSASSGMEVSFYGGPIRHYLAGIGHEQRVQLSDDLGHSEIDSCASKNPLAILLERLTGLIGRAPLPPRWVLGYHQSRWGYQSEAEMRRVWAGFQEHRLPLSGLFLDIDHLRGYRTLTPDEQRYPQLAEFAEALHRHDVHLVAITNPGVKLEPGFDLYDTGTDQDLFCKAPDGRAVAGVVWPGRAVFVDYANPVARRWWGEQYDRQLKHGIDGFWHDMNEPTSFTIWGDPTLPRCTRHNLEGRQEDHSQVHNIYGQLMNQAAYQGLRDLKPDRRPFILSRSGWVGMQRTAWSWTGDIETSWAALRQTITTVLGLGLCGMPFTGPDIGGFSGHPSPELFIRWFQLATFLPFFRTHCAFFLPRREPWEWGPTVLAQLCQCLELRYRLLPYWYTLAWSACQTGSPIVRPLFWDAPDDPSLWQVDDAFLVGNELLVAPVLEQGARQRKVRLPIGYWHRFTGASSNQEMDRYLGGGEIQLAAPLEWIPVLARPGSIIPVMKTIARETGEAGEDQILVLHIYRSNGVRPAHGMLYSDAGDGFGQSRLDRFALEPVGAEDWNFTWNVEGQYPWPYSALELCLHGFSSAQVWLNGRSLPAENNGTLVYSACSKPPVKESPLNRGRSNDG